MLIRRIVQAVDAVLAMQGSKRRMAPRRAAWSVDRRPAAILGPVLGMGERHRGRRAVRLLLRGGE